MKILVLGATGGTGRLIVSDGVAKGDSSFGHGLDPLRRRTGFEARLKLSRERSIVFVVPAAVHTLVVVSN
jgi:hypothetical protein